MAKGGNYGSIKRLNWVTPNLDDKVSKSFDRPSTEPLTRGGHTALRPAPEGPRLYLNKAILQPMKYGPGGMQFQRKRDATGKFAPAQSAGKQSTAEEDQIDQQRDAKLRQHRLQDRLHGDSGGKTMKAMVPGASGTDISSSSINDSSNNVIGTTMAGQPIYDDPFHSAHAQFSDQDHQEAANLHSQMMQDSQAQGDMAGAAQHKSAADAHTQQATDGMTPGGRFMDNLFNQQGPPQVQPDDMSQFSDLLGSAPPPMQQGNPAVAGGDPSMQQGNPAIAGGDSFSIRSPMATTPPPPPPSMTPTGGPGMPGQPAQAGTDPLGSFLGQDSSTPNQGMPPMGADQNKPLMNQDMGPGPKPGMMDAQTGMPTGQQTDVGEFSDGPPQYDLTSLFGEDASQDDPMYDEPGLSNDMGDTPDEINAQTEDTGQGDGSFDFGGGSSGGEEESDGGNPFGGSQDQGQDGGNPFGGGQDQDASSDMDVPDSNAGAPGPNAKDSEDQEYGSSDEDKKEATMKALAALARYV